MFFRGVQNAYEILKKFYIFRSRLVECSARTNHNIREVFKTFLFLSKIAPNVSSSRTSSRRTSDEEAKLNGLSGNGHNGSGEKQFNFPRSDEIILTSSQQHTTTSRLSRWGSLKDRSSSPAINSSPKESPLRRNVSAYGRSGRFSRKAENENPNEAQVSRTRKKIHSGSKGNGIDPLEIHFEQVSVSYSVLLNAYNLYQDKLNFTRYTN